MSAAVVPFGPYELVHRLGAGGMAETFLAIRRGPGGFEQQVCVKRILPALEGDADFVGQFMEEARLAAQLRHGNITQVVDFGVADGSHYLALELVDGLDLRHFLRRLAERGERMDGELTALLATEIARALEFAHRPLEGRSGRRPAVIHRDISPSNVLLSRVGEVYLTDFGIARALGVERRTDSGVVKGKIPYMAPEYALHRRFDARSDLFSLGVLLYECLAGERPFLGPGDLEILRQAREGRHLPLDHLAPNAPPALVAIVEDLLRPNPDERTQSAAALLDALTAVAPSPTVARRLGEQVRSMGMTPSQTLGLSSAERTAAATIEEMPAVRPAGPEWPTRTKDALEARAESPWSATDPAKLARHSGPPRGASPAAPPPPTARPPLARTRLEVPPPVGPSPPRPSRGVLPLLVLGGALAFAAAGLLAYGVVTLLVR
jgi:serine/threonine protein kinase